GSIKAVQIFNSVGHSEAGTQVEMELGMADKGEVHENDVTVSLLQRNRCVDGGGGGAGAALRSEEREDAGFARSTPSARAVGTETREGFEHSFRAGAFIQIFASSCTHAGHDGSGLLHRTVGQDGKLKSIDLKEFDDFNGRVRIVGGDIDDDDFGAHVLN